MLTGYVRLGIESNFWTCHVDTVYQPMDEKHSAGGEAGRPKRIKKEIFI
jgi:hypothetical protein